MVEMLYLFAVAIKQAEDYHFFWAGAGRDIFGAGPILPCVFVLAHLWRSIFVMPDQISHLFCLFSSLLFFCLAWDTFLESTSPIGLCTSGSTSPKTSPYSN